MTAQTVTKPQTRPTPTVWLAVFAAAVPNVLIWILTVLVVGHDLVAEQAAEAVTVTVPWVVGGSLLSAAAGLGVATFLRRFARGRVIWLVVSIVALVGSFNGPLSGTTTATVLVLASMHVVVGVAVILGGLALQRGDGDVRRS